VLKQHCEDVGRSYDDIEKTVLFRFDLGEKNENINEIVTNLRNLAAMGFTVAHGGLKRPWQTQQFEVFQKEIVPAAEAL
jgi:hypothetical protein